MVVGSTFLSNYSDELNEIFKTYIEDINPFIVQFEIMKNEFPIELQNEIRAMYGHLSRAAIATSDEEVKRNISKIKSHTKRALLDCYKYSCVLLIDKYHDFFERYKSIDLTYLDKGSFLQKIDEVFQQTKDLLKTAKNAELTNMNEEALFEMYQKAYISAVEIDKTICSVEGEAIFLKRKATKKDIMCVASLVVGIVGAIIGVIGILL